MERKGISLVQGLGFAITILGACLTAYISLVSRITALEVKQTQNENDIKDIKTIVNRIDTNINEIRISIIRLEDAKEKKK